MNIYFNLSVFEPEHAIMLHSDLKDNIGAVMRIADLMTGIEFLFKNQKKMLDKVDLFPKERFRIYQQLEGMPSLSLINNQKEKQRLNKLFYMDQVGCGDNASLEYVDYEQYWLVDLLGWRKARFSKDYDKIVANVKNCWTPEADKILQECVQKNLDNTI